MKIFLSYSTPDEKLVHEIANYIRRHAEVYYWDKSKVPGSEVWPTIFKWIDQSDLVLVVITGNTVSRAMSVGQEVGHAKAKDKTIIPIVSSEVPISELGFLSGIIYQQIDPKNPGPAMQAIERIVLGRKQQIEWQRELFIIGGILLLVWLGSKK